MRSDIIRNPNESHATARVIIDLQHEGEIQRLADRFAALSVMEVDEVYSHEFERIRDRLEMIQDEG